ncbi:S-adenosyl-L-methionine-dependent methyltransferase [Cladochytrium replicatum]|nr:S-adenosyl-L-methionine-dependent methyltransferase [Cladochytrium replicatum]
MTLWDLDEIAAFYGSYAAKYDDEIQADTYPAPFVVGSWIVEHVLAGNSTPSGAIVNKRLRVLDVGCGTGQSSIPFFRAGTDIFDVYGVDATPEMLERARKHPFKQVRCQDVEAPLEFDEPFNAIVCIGVMDFIKNPSALLSEISKRLYPGPASCFGVTLPESGDLNAFTLPQMMTLVEDAGFQVARHEQLFGYKDSQTGEIAYYHGFLLTHKRDAAEVRL